MNKNQKWLRRFSKLTCFSTLFLIFAGSMVTSTESGLAVPDWPLSYGMIFPPMVGGVFYEHGHRMIAATVGFLTVILAVWLGLAEKRKWVKVLGFAALGAVITQGVLGGITVILMLPPLVSVSHAVLSQTFFILTIILAYSQSRERAERTATLDEESPALAKAAVGVTFFVYVQLILGALMRHTGSGLAIPDFPTMGGYLIPPFNDEMLRAINEWRFKMNLEPVVLSQVLIHFSHRIGAVPVTVIIGILNFVAIRSKLSNVKILRSILAIDIFLLLQLILGVATIWTHKAPLIASLHVVVGASILGISTLLTLRSFPTSIKNLRSELHVSSLS